MNNLNDSWPGGTLHNGPHGVVTTPTPEPSTVIVAGAGSLAFLGLGWLRNRKRRAA